MDRKQVDEAVERVAASEGFAQSERLCRFLRFTVGATLDGRSEEIKEYVIGREVFDRGDEYDPRTDPIVRVEARRLRKKLDEYYSRAGAGESIRIGYPKGSYVPELTGPPEVARRWWMAGGICAAGGAVIAWHFGKPGAKLVVLPARWTWDSAEFPQTPHDVDLAERTGAELANRRGVHVVAWPIVQRYEKGTRLKDIARELGVSEVLLIAVRFEAAGPRVTAYLIDAATDRKVQVIDFENVDLSMEGRRGELARRIADNYKGR